MHSYRAWTHENSINVEKKSQSQSATNVKLLQERKKIKGREASCVLSVLVNKGNSNWERRTASQSRQRNNGCAWLKSSDEREKVILLVPLFPFFFSLFFHVLLFTFSNFASKVLERHKIKIYAIKLFLLYIGTKRRPWCGHFGIKKKIIKRHFPVQENELTSIKTSAYNIVPFLQNDESQGK